MRDHRLVPFLGDNPEIFFPFSKEMHHFVTDYRHYSKVESRSEYLARFAEAGSCTVVGDASPRHLSSEEAAKNIANFNPDAKILIFVRDHADYLESLFNQHRWAGIEDLRDFRTAWELSGRRRIEDLLPPFKSPGLLDYRRAAEFHLQVKRYFDASPADQIRVFHLADWTKVPRGTYVEILDFLGVKDDGRTESPPVNEALQRRSDFVLRLLRTPLGPSRQWLRGSGASPAGAA